MTNEVFTASQIGGMARHVGFVVTAPEDLPLKVNRHLSDTVIDVETEPSMPMYSGRVLYSEKVNPLNDQPEGSALLLDIQD